MGTPVTALPSLQRCLDDGHEVVAVWTQPDRPSGRGNILTPSPVKQFALARGLTIHQPAKIKTEAARALFASHNADVVVVVAYGRILPREFLSAPRRGCLNVHFSLLPLYRGAAPVNWAIVNGETRTGVTTMFIEEKLDAGPILLQSETEINADETAPELTARLALMGAELLGQTLASLDTITPHPQRDRDATLAPMLTKEDGLIDWSSDAFAIERCVRGFQPWPSAYTHWRSQHLIVWRAVAEAATQNEPIPGEILTAHGDDLIVNCGQLTQLRLLEVQPEGKRRMSARDFLNGAHLQVGEKLA
jgi:methionyl-tRNA formyltransferase